MRKALASVVMSGAMLLLLALPAHADVYLTNAESAGATLYTTWDNHQGIRSRITENDILVGGCSCIYAYENLYYGPVSNNVVINQHSAVIGGESTATWYDPHDSLPYDCGSYNAAVVIFSSSWQVLWSGVLPLCY